MSNPAGVFRAGGYERCPTFYGSSSSPTIGISDKDNGWWPTDLITGNYVGNIGNSITLDIPRWSAYKTVLEDSSLPGATNMWLSPTLDITKVSAVGGGNAGDVVGSFRWRISVRGSVFNRSIEANPINVTLTTPNISGQVTFPFTPYSNFIRVFFDQYNNRYSDTFAQYNVIVNEYGQVVERHTAIPANPWCLMFVSNSVTLSISTTLS
jgi:hypothetical protein